MSDRQQESIQACWVPLLAHFGVGRDPATITFDDVVESVSVRRTAGLRGQSIRKERQALGRGLHVAKRLGALTEIPDLPKIKNDSVKRDQTGTFREPELGFRFLEALQAVPRSYPARQQAELVVRTGLRRDEGRPLELSWVEVLANGTDEIPALLNVSA